MKKEILLLCSVFLIIGMSFALAQRGPQRVPAIRTPIETVQPDGDTLVIRLHGDERRHYATTEDGFLIRTNSKGYYCYAVEGKDGAIVPTRKVAHNKENRTRCEWRYIKRHIPQPYKAVSADEEQEQDKQRNIISE